MSLFFLFDTAAAPYDKLSVLVNEIDAIRTVNDITLRMCCACRSLSF